jgi:hypothetical protein
MMFTAVRPHPAGIPIRNRIPTGAGWGFIVLFTIILSHRQTPAFENCDLGIPTKPNQKGHGSSLPWPDIKKPPEADGSGLPLAYTQWLNLLRFRTPKKEPILGGPEETNRLLQRLLLGYLLKKQLLLGNPTVFQDYHPILSLPLLRVICVLPFR